MQEEHSCGIFNAVIPNEVVVVVVMEEAELEEFIVQTDIKRGGGGQGFRSESSTREAIPGMDLTGMLLHSLSFLRNPCVVNR